MYVDFSCTRLENQKVNKKNSILVTFDIIEIIAFL